MQFAAVSPGGGGYLAIDACDNDEIVWSDGAKSDPALAPTGHHVLDINSLLRNRSPRTGKKLRVKIGRISGFALAVTAPKCFSVLELMGPASKLLQGVSADAARECLQLASWLSAQLDSPSEPKQPSRLAACSVMHRLSRVENPHRHAHLLVYSLEKDPKTGVYGAADLSSLLRAGNVFQSLFQQRLALGMVAAGYRIERDIDSFKVAGFSRELVDRFSGASDARNFLKSHRKRPRAEAEFDLLREGWFARCSPHLRKPAPWNALGVSRAKLLV
jgi:hypothetical protein